MSTNHEGTGIITMAFAMATAMGRLTERARAFYYAVMLSGHACPDCAGGLEMVAEGRCRCVKCGRQFDPTTEFERCLACGGRPRLVVRRYTCSHCGADVASRFLFDGLIFDAEYFRQKMAESRQRRQELRERVRQMLAGSRSEPVVSYPADFTGVPDLLDALNRLVQEDPAAPDLHLRPAFNLSRYQAHIQAHTSASAISLDSIPPSSENPRQDRIWRFIAIIFLAHAGVLDVWQNGPDIMVKQRETDSERQGVPGEPAQAHGIEGSVG